MDVCYIMAAVRVSALQNLYFSHDSLSFYHSHTISNVNVNSFQCQQHFSYRYKLANRIERLEIQSLRLSVTGRR